MKKLIILILLLIPFVSNAQKHLEIVSEVCDSMMLINKEDGDYINNIFNEKSKLDSIIKIDNIIINNLSSQKNKLDSLIEFKDSIIYNSEELILQLKTDNIADEQYYKNEIKKEKTKKHVWQGTTFAGILGIFIILLL